MKNIIVLILVIFALNSNAQDLIAFEVNGLWGYKNVDSTAIKPQYQYAYDFWHGKGLVFMNDKCGVINTRGKVIIPFEYDQISILNDSLLRIGNRAKMIGTYYKGVVNSKGEEILSMDYSSIQLKNTFLIVEKRRDSLIVSGEFAGFTSVKKTYGINSLDGKQIFEPIFDRIEWIDENTIKVNKGKYYALIDGNGTYLTELKYTAFSDFYNGKAAIRIDSLYGFINRKGIEVISPKFKTVSSFYRDTTVYRMHNGRVGFIDSSGSKIFETDYEILRFPHLQCAAAREKGKWGLISLNGECLIPFEHDNYVREFEGIIAFRKNNKYAIFNNNGERKTDYEFDSVVIFGGIESKRSGFWKINNNKYKERIALVTKDELKAVVNTNGELIIPFGLSPEKLNIELAKLEIR